VSSVELAFYTPILFLVIFITIQFGLGWRGRVLFNVIVDVDIVGANVRATGSGDPLGVIDGLTPRASKAVEEPIEQFGHPGGRGGILESDLPRVFDLAFRGAAARSPDPDSTPTGGGGLGLAIVRGLVGLHDGEVSVTNADGGCRFTVRLPAAAAAAPMPSSE
jgi:hypothetical protein